MTHDELLAKIDEKLEKHANVGMSSSFDDACGYCIDSFPCETFILALALRAVVELHYLAEGDWDENANAREPAHWCACCSDVFPCPTIQALSNELK